MDPVKFDLRSQFEAQLRLCLPRATTRLRLFDPDFRAWPLGAGDVCEMLRHFLVASQRNRLQLAGHSLQYLQKECPRFMQLLRDFGHAIECRVTPARLRHLTDSFCIADDTHIVRRYHCDQSRGCAASSQAECAVPAQRFAAIWAESELGLSATPLGL